MIKMWPFKKKPVLTLSDIVKDKPDVLCGKKEQHYQWTLFNGMSCPFCVAIKEKQRKEKERLELAKLIAKELAPILLNGSTCCVNEKRKKSKMRGTPHNVEVLDTRFDEESRSWVPCDKFVYLSNNDDEHYNQIFENRNELDEFIEKLVSARDEAFGPAPKS